MELTNEAQCWDRLWFVMNAVMGVVVFKSTLFHVSLQLNVRNRVLMFHTWAH